MATYWNASDKDNDITLSNTNQNAAVTGAPTGGAYSAVRSNDGKSSGKWWFAVKLEASDAGGVTKTAGIGTATHSLQQFVGNAVDGYGYGWGGTLYNNNGGSGTPATYTTGDFICFAVDVTNNKMWVGKNVDLGGGWYNSGNPDAGTNASFTISGSKTYYPMVSMGASGSNVDRFRMDNGVNIGGFSTATTFSMWSDGASSGTMAVTDTQDTTAWVAKVVSALTMAATDTQDTSAAVAKVITAITMASTEAADTPAFTGTVVDVASGTLAATEAADTFAGTGYSNPVNLATFALTEPQDTTDIQASSILPTPILVAVGGSGRALKSLDHGASWTSFSATTTSQLNGVTQLGVGGSWVAVGSGGKIFKSTDLATWTAKTSPVTTDLNSCAYGNGYLIAVGAAGKVIRSTDGDTWTLVSTLTGSLNDVTWNVGWGLFVIVGTVGKLYTSPDGSVWSLRTTPIPTATLYGVYAAPSSGTIVVTSSTKFLKTADAGSIPSYAAPDTSVKYDVTWNGTTYITSGYNKKITYSSNGTSWSTRTITTSTVTYNDITWDGTNFVMVGNRDFANTLQSAISYSADGVTWTPVSPGTTEGLFCVFNGYVPGSGDFSHGTMAAIDTPDTGAFGGYFQTTNAGSLYASENQDIFVTANGSFMWFDTDDQPDTVLISGSQGITGTLAATDTPDTLVFQEGGQGGSLSIQISQDTVDQIVTFGAELFDGGTLRIYTGSQPADTAAAVTGTLMATIVLPDPAWVDAIDGTAEKTGTWTGTAVNTGICGWFRLTSADGLGIIDGTCSAASGTGDLLMSVTSATVGDVLEVTVAHFEMEFNT